MLEIVIPSTKVPVLTECDVLVCGAGPAGCAAAISAARSGLKTVLVERWSFPGGMGTAGLVNIFHVSDRKKQVIFGIMQELIERGLKKGYCKQYDHFPVKHETHEFDVEGLKVLYEEMLSEAKVNLLYTLTAGDVIAEGETIKAVLCDTKTGRKAIIAKIFIDATGDGDVAAKAGVPFEFGRSEDGLVQGMTLMYKLMDIDREKALAMTAAEHNKIIDRMKHLAQEGRLPPFGPVSFRYYAEDGHPNMCPVAGNPLDEASLTQCSIKARKQIEAYLKFFREEVPGFKSMKKGYTLLVCLAVLGSGLIPQRVMAGEEIAAKGRIIKIENPDFEIDADGNNLPDKWSMAGGGVGIDRTTFHSGKQSVMILVPSDKPYGDLFCGNIPIKPYTLYTLTVWYKTLETWGGGGAVFFIQYDGEGKILQSSYAQVPVFSEWNKSSRTWTTMAGAVKAGIILRNYPGQAESWWDDVSLVEGDNIGELMEKAGKEAEEIEKAHSGNENIQAKCKEVYKNVEQIELLLKVQSTMRIEELKDSQKKLDDLLKQHKELKNELEFINVLE